MAESKKVSQKDVEKVTGAVPTSVTMHLDRDPNDERVARVKKHENSKNIDK